MVKKLDKGNGVLLEIFCGGWELGSPNPEGRPAPFPMSYTVGQEDKRTNNRTMFPSLKNNAAAGYQGSVKKELLN